jgi:hypothetical protein
MRKGIKGLRAEMRNRVLGSKAITVQGEINHRIE